MTSANTNCRVIDVDGAQLYADVRSGTAPALVFLHYWGGSRRTWQPVLTRLHPDQAFVTYDQRGWGDSVNAPGPYDMERLADDAQSVIATLGYTDYVLVGHSMGGKIAQALAARRPAGLAGVVLVAPAPATPVGSPLEVPDQVASQSRHSPRSWTNSPDADKRGAATPQHPRILAPCYTVRPTAGDRLWPRTAQFTLTLLTVCSNLPTSRRHRRRQIMSASRCTHPASAEPTASSSTADLRT